MSPAVTLMSGRFSPSCYTVAITLLSLALCSAPSNALRFASTAHWHPNAAAALGTPPRRGLRALTAPPRRDRTRHFAECRTSVVGEGRRVFCRGYHPRTEGEHQGHVQGRCIGAGRGCYRTCILASYTAFSDEELGEIRSTIGLKAAEKSSSSGTTPPL